MNDDRPTGEQQLAIDCDDSDILVVAGAGTGKTRTTIDRYARLIGEGKTESSILVFTFTEKAANQLRNKVRALRTPRSGDEEMPAGGAGQGLSMGSTWVGTFHSICARILRAHPIAADVDPAFTILDEIQSSLLRDRAWDAALLEMTAKPENLTVISRFTPSVLKTGIENVWERLRSFGYAKPRLPAPGVDRPDVAGLVAELGEAATSALDTPRIQSATKNKIHGIIDRLEELPRNREPTFEEVRSLSPDPLPDSVPALRDRVDELAAWAAENSFGKETFEVLDSLLEVYGTELAKRKVAAGALDFEDLQLLTLDLLHRHPGIAASYRDQFSEIMVDEFQDTNPLQMKLIEALRGETTTLFTVGDEMQAIYGFRHADIELFRARDRDPGVTTLHLSQNFRSVGPIIGAVNEIGKRVTDGVRALRDGDRAGSGGEGTSHQFQELVNAKRGGSAAGDGVELLISEEKAWSGIDLGPLHPLPEGESQPAAGRPKSSGQYEAEALSLAGRIREVIDREEFRPDEIVILFRGRSRMWIFEMALRQVGIPAYTVGGSGFWDTREGIDLRALLAMLANPEDDDALLGVLAGPACGLSSDGLWALASAREPDFQESRDLDVSAPRASSRQRPSLPLWSVIRNGLSTGVPLEQTDRERIETLVSVIIRLRGKMALTPLGEIVETVVRETGYDLVNVLRDPSGGGLANIRRVASLAAAYESDQGRNLRGLIEWIDLSRDLDAEAAVATEGEDSNAVRLMTIHSSKGLQFGMVCVADMGRPRRSDSESVIWVGRGSGGSGELVTGLSAPIPGEDESLKLFAWNQLDLASNRASADEELRLLHVALTRAERRLLLSGVNPLPGPPSITENSSHLSRVVAGLGLRDEGDSPRRIPIAAPEVPPDSGFSATESSILVFFNRASSERGAELAREHPLLKPDDHEDDPGRTPPLTRPGRPSLPEVPLSYSALSIFEECPARFFATRVLKLEDPAGTTKDHGQPVSPTGADDVGALDLETYPPPSDCDGTAFGSAVHRVLEDVSRNRWIRPSDGAIKRELGAAGLDPGSEVTARARQMIDGFMASPLGKSAAEQPSKAESGLVVQSGKVLLRGLIDLILPDAEPPMVIDYKTNRLDGSTPEEKMAGYELQRDIYALGVSRARNVNRVATAYVFLEQPGQPVERLYDRDHLSDAAERLDALTSEIGDGRYLGGPDALHQPCGECWACDLLAGRIEPANRP